MLKLIKTTVLDASAASVTISNIPQQFKTLKLVMSLRNAGTTDAHVDMAVSFNGSTANFTRRHLYGNGTGAGSGNGADLLATYSNPATYTASTFSNSEIVIPNYSGSSNKAFAGMAVTEQNATGAFSALFANLWSNTAAITSIKVEDLYDSNGFAAGSAFYLYGIA